MKHVQADQGATCPDAYGEVVREAGAAREGSASFTLECAALQCQPAQRAAVVSAFLKVSVILRHVCRRLTLSCASHACATSPRGGSDDSAPCSQLCPSSPVSVTHGTDGTCLQGDDESACFRLLVQLPCARALPQCGASSVEESTAGRGVIVWERPQPQRRRLLQTYSAPGYPCPAPGIGCVWGECRQLTTSKGATVEACICQKDVFGTKCDQAPGACSTNPCYKGNCVDTTLGHTW